MLSRTRRRAVATSPAGSPPAAGAAWKSRRTRRPGTILVGTKFAVLDVAVAAPTRSADVPSVGSAVSAVALAPGLDHGTDHQQRGDDDDLSADDHLVDINRRTPTNVAFLDDEHAQRLGRCGH